MKEMITSHVFNRRNKRNNHLVDVPLVMRTVVAALVLLLQQQHCCCQQQIKMQHPKTTIQSSLLTAKNNFGSSN
jgi:hypothetical protein